MSGEDGIGKGDFLHLSIGYFSFQILIIDKYSPEVDCVKMSFIQFATSGILSIPVMMILGEASASEIGSCIFPIIYTCIFSGAIVYTLQIIGQKYADITTSALSMSL